MRKSWARLYAPFLALAMIQAALVLVAPSRGDSQQQVTSFGAAGSGRGFASDGAGGDEFASTAGASSTSGSGTGSGVSSSAGGGRTTRSGAAVTGGSNDAIGSAPGATVGTTPLGPGGGLASTGDTSHCTPGGRQFAVLLNGGPPCVAKFTGNNGGATSQGVTGDTVKIVFFSSKPNDQVDAILGSQGLAVPYAQSVDYIETALAFVEKHYELYGRKIEPVFVQGDCPTTPPDYDVCNAEAQKVAKLNPFMVVWGTPLYASVFDIWAKHGIVSLGGWHFSNEFFTGRRPYRYDPFMQGSESADVIAEYYCKKLAKQNASHSGQVIHPQVGTRGSVARKLGIVVPEIEANVLTAKRVAGAVEGCDPGKQVPIFTYESDIERATEQTQATVSGLIDADVTTVVCMCDPIAPAFLTSGMTANNYFPEYLTSGMGFVDDDLVGRLYDKQQMRHAFGPSQVATAIPRAEGDSARVWREMGRPGSPCGKNGCGIQWAYVNLLATGLQMAGPDLNPLSFERGLLTMPPSGGWATGDPRIVLSKFGQNDYTGLSDFREVYWSNSRQSPVDGERGGYVDVNGGRRYELGQLTVGLEGVPVEPN